MASSVQASPIDGTPLDALALLGALVLKRGVALGGLTHPERLVALRVAAQALVPGDSATEAQVNAALKAQLAGDASFLDADHVELRRWLVDTGWWQRDGFGRAYARVDAAALPEPLRSIDAAVAPLDLPGWIADRRAQAQSLREARRAAWQARTHAGPDGTASHAP